MKGAVSDITHKIFTGINIKWGGNEKGVLKRRL